MFQASRLSKLRAGKNQCATESSKTAPTTLAMCRALGLSEHRRYEIFADAFTLRSSSAPSARVGAATTELKGKLYMFSGRGGVAVAPIDERGSLWALEPSTDSWSSIAPSSNSYPAPRSYHCMTNDGQDTIYVHAGCPEKGRLSDLWAFTVSTSEWKQLAAAPDPPRGGPSMAFVDGRIYRMNGFDGEHEQGGSIDVYDIAANSWSSIDFLADGVDDPGARSVAALLPVRVNDDTWLVTLLGESDPSNLGHQGAGKMLSDVWAYSLEAGKWSRVTTSSGAVPEGRGWFDADVVNIDGKDGVVVVGGLGESNERLDDAWLLGF